MVQAWVDAPGQAAAIQGPFFALLAILLTIVLAGLIVGAIRNKRSDDE
jgi:hypothetical protein